MNSLAQNIDVESILNYYSISNITFYGEECNFSCPFPEHYRGDLRPSSYINAETYRYNCFGCNRSGTIYTFIAELEEITEEKAKEFIQKDFVTEYLEQNSIQEYLKSILNKPIERNQSLPVSTMNIFDVDWEKAYSAYKEHSIPKALKFIFDRGFKPDILSRYRLGYDMKSKRITIPVFDDRGNLVGFKGRATNNNQSPKYSNMGDRKDKPIYYGFKPYKVGNFIWGLDSADDSGIIVEGELDALWLRQLGFQGSVALGGSNPTNKQISLLRDNFSNIVLFLDPDEAGRKAADKLRKNLVEYFPLTVAECLEELDPADMNKEQIIQALKQSKSQLRSKI